MPPQSVAAGSGEPPAVLTKRTAFASTFALTAANPATVVAFVGVVSALGASSATSSSAAFQLVLGVFLGSMFWWLTLVALVRSARHLILPSAFRWLDLTTGAVLLLTGLWIAGKAVLA